MKKNIAIIVPVLRGGGAERAAAKLSCNLSSEYSKNIIVYDDKAITYDYSGELVNLDCYNSNGFWGKIKAFIKRLYFVRRIKRRKKIKTTISFMENANFINILSKKNNKVIISIRNYKSKGGNDFYSKLNRFFMKFLYNKADYIVPVSKLIKQDLIDNYGLKPEKIRVIYNSYSTQEIRKQGHEELEQEYIDFFKGEVIATMGRLEPQKGQIHLIRCFAELKDEFPNTKLLIIGTGSLEVHLKDMVEELNIVDDVKFMGYTLNPFKYLSKSSIFVFPSLYEGFPNALCEAMACGLPVIAADCKSGPREILSPNSDINYETNNIEYAEYGILIPAFELAEENLAKEEIMIESIRCLLVDNKLRDKYSMKAKKRVGDFSTESTIKQWEKII